uniref:Uncharacterized protein n=1 Tax=Arion vulgaris TaxID=1028688 RepID=A0A0B7AT43_9EUPU
MIYIFFTRDNPVDSINQHRTEVGSLNTQKHILRRRWSNYGTMSNEDDSQKNNEKTENGRPHRCFQVAK